MASGRAKGFWRRARNVYRFRTHRRCCGLRFGRMNRLRQDRGLCPSACSTILADPTRHPSSIEIPRLATFSRGFPGIFWFDQFRNLATSPGSREVETENGPREESSEQVALCRWGGSTAAVPEPVEAPEPPWRAAW